MLTIAPPGAAPASVVSTIPVRLGAATASFAALLEGDLLLSPPETPAPPPLSPVLTAGPPPAAIVCVQPVPLPPPLATVREAAKQRSDRKSRQQKQRD
jgi:hypothetical protein